jgi:hypothetical protein
MNRAGMRRQRVCLRMTGKVLMNFHALNLLCKLLLCVQKKDYVQVLRLNVQVISVFLNYSEGTQV